MRKLTVDENIDTLINNLLFFHNYCEKNKLKYCIFYGTLIGAIRHKGFIPWDDDIDVIMPRKDYEFLINNLSDKRYKIADCRFDYNYYLPYGKLYDSYTLKVENIYQSNPMDIGVDIDIFPLDTYKNINSIKFLSLKNKILSKKFILSIRNYTNDKNIKHIFLNFLSYFFHGKANCISRRILKNCLKSSDENGKILACTVDMYPYKPPFIDTFDHTIFDNRILRTFEGHEFWCPENYDFLLKRIYGNYMELPSKEQQISHHGCSVYWKENIDIAY